MAALDASSAKKSGGGGSSSRRPSSYRAGASVVLMRADGTEVKGTVVSYERKAAAYKVALEGSAEEVVPGTTALAKLSELRPGEA